MTQAILDKQPKDILGENMRKTLGFIAGVDPGKKFPHTEGDKSMLDFYGIYLTSPAQVLSRTLTNEPGQVTFLSQLEMYMRLREQADVAGGEYLDGSIVGTMARMARVAEVVMGDSNTAPFVDGGMDLSEDKLAEIKRKLERYEDSSTQTDFDPADYPFVVMAACLRKLHEGRVFSSR